MPDVVDARTRSRMMSGIRSRDTRPEMAIRRALHAAGFRYRLHSPSLPGKPDLALRRYGAAIFINGCFWHGHDCHLFRLPGTRTEFWAAKIGRNRERDAEVRARLAGAGWRCLTVWECALRGRTGLPFAEVMARITGWLTSGAPAAEIRGNA